ncbi:MAG: hypothetical protein WAO35_21505 [Terriglobia bacterium]
MKKWAISFVTGLMVGAVLLPAARANETTLPPPPPLVIPAGSLLHVRLTCTVTSKTSKPGDPFTGIVTQPILVDGKEVIGAGSSVEGHVAFVKRSGRVAGVAQMRIVLDDIITTDDVKLALPAGLEDMNAGPCAKTGSDDEGTIKGCGKNKKDAMKDAAIGGAMGAGGGSMVGIGHEIDCEYYGNCGGPGFGADIGMGAGIGAGTVLIYDLLKHEKHIILVQGTTMTFVISRSVDASTGKPLEPTAPAEAAKQ